MFDINDPSSTRIKKDTPIDRLPSAKEADEAKPNHELDSDENHERHSMLLSYYRQELDRQGENRYQMAIDEDYYDNDQWTPEEANELKERGQQPTVYNVIATSVDWIIGSEKRGRTDFKILPRGKEDAKPAEAKTKFLKYLSDVNRSPFHRSRAFEDAVKVGIGWLESGAQDEDDGEPIYTRYESWRNILWDSASTEMDGSDMRYVFRSKWVDEDIAKKLFPQRADVVELSVIDSTLYGSFDMVDGDIAMDLAEFEREHNGIYGTIVTHKRRRVRLIEAWYRVPEKVKRLRGGRFTGEIYDDKDPRHTESVKMGESAVIEKVMMRTRVAVMTTTGLLFDGASPYRHNKFKFIPIWGYRRGKDGLPYGVIRRMRDIQDGVNKRASKALHILSTNKVIMDEGAVDDIDEFAKEVARPDAIIVKKPGKALDLNVDRELAAPHLELMSRDINMIQQVGGVSDELLGRTTNAVSGVAVQRRQEQGSLATSKFFDNLRFAEQLRGEIELSMIEQFVTEEKQFRITNMRGTPDFVVVNDGLPENDITRTKADFVISEADWRATMRQAAVDQLSEMLKNMPGEIALSMLDLLVEDMDLPNREELVKRIRAVNGQKDPDATEPTPEDIQREQAAAQANAIQQAMVEADLREKNAKAAKAEADAERVKRMGIGDSVSATESAMRAAQAVITMPTIAKVADNILAEAGWQQAHPPAQGLPQQQMPPPDAMPPEMAQQMPPQEAAPEAIAPNGMVQPMDQPPEGV
jgi:hypothetical protein